MKKLDIFHIIIYSVFALLAAGFFLLFASKQDYNCSDFKTQKEAQEVFKRNMYDIYKLDANHNGWPCEELK